MKTNEHKYYLLKSVFISIHSRVLLSSFLFSLSYFLFKDFGHCYLFVICCFLTVFFGLSIGRGFEISFPKNTDFMHPFATGSLYLFCAVS